MLRDSPVRALPDGSLRILVDIFRAAKPPESLLDACFKRSTTVLIASEWYVDVSPAELR